jgi:hypothetical protein
MVPGPVYRLSTVCLHVESKHMIQGLGYRVHRLSTLRLHVESVLDRVGLGPKSELFALLRPTP